MSEDAWLVARLIPTSGIAGAEEQERRATSALLAVMMAVKEFGRAVTQPLGAPAGTVHTYIEVPFKLDGKQYFPDGLIRVSRGQRHWTALVEVKTGSNQLKTEQLERYLEIAREQGFDGLITISNEIPPVAGYHPTPVDRRKTKKVALHHLPWTEILTAAVIQKEYRGIADPDQAWILGELIRYLEHPRSGALEFSDMGAAWVTAREAVTAGTLRPSDAAASEIAGRFDALLRYAGLRLGRRLGTEVVPNISRRDVTDPAARTQALAQSLATTGSLSGSLRVPGAVGPLHITADLRAGQIICHVDVDAPREGRPTTRVNWLVRQLRDAPDGLRLEAFTLNSRGPGTAELLGTVRADAATLTPNNSKELRAFRIAQSTTAGTKRGTGRGAFIDSLLTAVDDFYTHVLLTLKPSMPAAPRLRPTDTPTPEPVPTPLISTAISSQDGPEPTPPEHHQPPEPADPATVTAVEAHPASPADPVPAGHGQAQA